MNTKLNKNGTTLVLLSSKMGQFASMLLDWNCQLLHYELHSIDMSKSPCVDMKASCLYDHSETMKPKMDEKGWPKIVLCPQYVEGPDGLYYLAYGSSDKCVDKSEDKKELDRNKAF